MNSKSMPDISLWETVRAGMDMLIDFLTIVVALFLPLALTTAAVLAAALLVLVVRDGKAERERRNREGE